MSRHKHLGSRCPTCHDTGTYTRRDELHTCTCTAGLEINLGDIPALTADLEITLARQTATSDRVGSRSSERLLPYDGRAGDTLTALHRMLAGWINELATTSPHQGPHCQRTCRHESCAQINRDHLPAPTIPAMSAWLLRLFPRLVTYPAIHELTSDVHEHVTAARRVIDIRAERWYAGPCRTPGCVDPDTPGKPRPTDMYAAVDAKQVHCPRCHTAYDVNEQRSWLLAAAEDRLATATDCARALTSLGQPVTPDRIWKWKERGRLIQHGQDAHERPMFRIGDVIDRLAADRDREARRAG